MDGRREGKGSGKPGGGPKGSPRRSPPGRRGGLRLRPLDGPDFEVVHPPCVDEFADDYEEAMQAWQAGEPEEARDMLRYALEGCRDNLWVHVALGRLALEEGRDVSLAQGHFGYAYELVAGSLPPDFRGLLPADRPANRPFLEAIEGLARCAEALGRRDEATKFRRQRSRFESRLGA